MAGLGELVMVYLRKMMQEITPILGIIQCREEVVLRIVANIKQKTIEPIIKATVSAGALIYTDEYDIYHQLETWEYAHKTVFHSAGEYVRAEDGDGFFEVHVNTVEGLWSWLNQ